MITFEFEDEELTVDLARISYKQALAIQEFTGQSIGDWQDSLDFQVVERDGEKVVLNPPAGWVTSVAALYWLTLRQSSIDAVITDVDFDVQGFYAAFLAASVIEAQRILDERKQAAPKSRPSRGRKAGTTASPASGTPTTTTQTARGREEASNPGTGS